MDDQARWMARLLEASLQGSGLSEREVEERLGWEPGSLGRMLEGTLECGPLQFLAILAELGPERRESPRFRRKDRGTRMVQDLIERYRGLGYGKPEIPRAAAALPDATEIEKTVDEVLRRTFGADREGKGKRGGG
jgi:hypothetical protein